MSDDKHLSDGDVFPPYLETLRDEFASTALSRMVFDTAGMEAYVHTHAELRLRVAQECYAWADAMMEARGDE